MSIKKINIKDIIKREKEETKIAYSILLKLIKKNKNNNIEPPTKEEIDFLKKHSSDLIKLALLIGTAPLPVPYITTIIILKRFGINLFPSNEKLEIKK